MCYGMVPTIRSGSPTSETVLHRNSTTSCMWFSYNVVTTLKLFLKQRTFSLNVNCLRKKYKNIFANLNYDGILTLTFHYFTSEFRELRVLTSKFCGSTSGASFNVILTLRRNCTNCDCTKAQINLVEMPTSLLIHHGCM